VRIETIAERIGLHVLQVLVLIACAWAFVGLGVSSYWIDELFTEFLLQQPDPWSLFQASLKDTHPPVYYLAAQAWRVVTGPGEAPLRALSALCAVGAVGVLYLGLRGVVSPLARAFACALAVGSKVWFGQAQNARMYAMGLLFGSIFLVAAVQAIKRARAGESAARPLIVAGVFGVLASLTHHYLFMGVGLATVYLLFAMRRMQDRVIVFVNGSVTLAIQTAFMALLLRSPAVAEDLWFDNSPAFIVQQTLVFLHEAFDPLQTLFLAALVAAGAWRLLVLRRARADGAPPPAVIGLGLLMAVGVLAVGIVSTQFLPNYSARNMEMQLPAIWLVAALLFDGALAAARPRLRLALVAVACLVTAGPVIALGAMRLAPHNEEWRHSAQHVASLPACRRAPLHVEYVMFEAFSTYAYAHYLPEAQRPNLRLHRIRLGEIAAPPPAWARGSIADAARPGACPIVMWTVHGLSTASLSTLAAAWSKDPALPPGKVLTVRPFPHDQVQRSVAALVRPRKADVYAFTLEVADAP
jgi:hypothetical protein